MRFMFYFSLFLIFVSQYSLQGVDVKELTKQFENLSQNGKQLTNGRSRNSDLKYLFGHGSMDSKKLGSKYDGIKNTLMSYMNGGK